MRKLTCRFTALCLSAAVMIGHTSVAWADEAYGPGFRNGIPIGESTQSGAAETEDAEKALENAGIGQEDLGGGESGVEDAEAAAAIEAMKANLPHLQTTYLVGDGIWSQPFQNDTWIRSDNHDQGFHGLSIFLTNIVGNVLYRTYTSSTGWSSWVINGQQTPNYPNDVNIEAVEIRFSGYVNNNYDIYYTAQLNDGSTMDWAKNGTATGTMGTGRYITGLRMAYYKKGSEFPYPTANPLISTVKDGIQEIDGQLRYINGDGSSFSGWGWDGNQRYYFNDSHPVTGWQYIDGYKYYFDETGKMLSDLEPVMGTGGPYQININKEMNTMTIYAKDGDNGFIIPVKTFLTSTGPDTPLGTYNTPEKYRWRDMNHGIYTQYATRVYKGFLIHSILYSSPNPMTLDPSTYNYLSIAESAGCIRLLTKDAKWVYDNCGIGTTVTIYNSPVPGPYERPAIEQIIPETQTWDPTDPNIQI